MDSKIDHVMKRKASESLQIQIDAKETQIEKARKQCTPKGGLDERYWSNASKYHGEIEAMEDLLLQKKGLDFELDGKGDDDEFSTTYASTVHVAKKGAAGLLKRLCATQAENVSVKSTAAKSKARIFMQLFTTSKFGLGVNTGLGKRDTKMQSNFRSSVIAAYNLRHPGGPEYQLFLWDCVLGRFDHRDNFTATHIFASGAGQNIMTSIFGPECKDELFSARNGLLLPSYIEKEFDSGFFVIVPAVPENASKAQLSLWENVHPREYKIRIIDHKRDIMNQYLPPVDGVSKKWADLDGSVLKFKSDYRPRARYLYYNYCVQTLRRAWKYKDSLQTIDKLTPGHGQQVWATKGGYIPENQLKALAEELGHEYEGILDGADASKNAEGEENALLIAVSQQLSKGVESEEDEDENEDEEDD